MGKKIKQVILKCDVCGIIPDDGESLWEMAGEIWCRKCCDNMEIQNSLEKGTEEKGIEEKGI